MSNQPFKVCPACGQPAVLSMPRCGRCGRPYPKPFPLAPGRILTAAVVFLSATLALGLCLSMFRESQVTTMAQWRTASGCVDSLVWESERDRLPIGPQARAAYNRLSLSMSRAQVAEVLGQPAGYESHPEIIPSSDVPVSAPRALYRLPDGWIGVTFYGGQVQDISATGQKRTGY